MGRERLHGLSGHAPTAETGLPGCYPFAMCSDRFPSAHLNRIRPCVGLRKPHPDDPVAIMRLEMPPSGLTDDEARTPVGANDREPTSKCPTCLIRMGTLRSVRRHELIRDGSHPDRDGRCRGQSGWYRGQRHMARWVKAPTPLMGSLRASPSAWAKFKQRTSCAPSRY